MPKQRSNPAPDDTVDALKLLRGKLDHIGGEPEVPSTFPRASEASPVAEGETGEEFVEEARRPSARPTEWPTTVPVDHIRLGGVNVRQDFDEDRLAELQAAIDTLGLLQPLVVAPEPGVPGYWHLIAGERRYRSICNLQWKTVPVRVIDVPPAQWRLVMMSENIQRENFTLAEEVHGYVLMIEEDHRSVAEIAEQVHITASYIYTILRACRNPRVREAIDEGLIPSRRMLMEISRIVGPEGIERVPGIVDRALRFLGEQHPTKSQLHRTIETWLHDIVNLEDPDVSSQKRKTATVWEKEQEHLQSVVARVMHRGQQEEMAALATLYQDAARDLERAMTLVRPSAKPRITILDEHGGPLGAE